MNDKIREIYVKFHTERREFIEQETERRFQKRILGHWSPSPSTKKECLYEAMNVRTEEEEFERFAQLLLAECEDALYKTRQRYAAEFISEYFGEEDETN